jgi:4-hydroxybenzoate polyprenyltransferase
MPHPLTSKKRAQAISTSLFLLGLACLIFIQVWWPGIMVVVGLPLALRQYLLGRTYDMIVTLVVFLGTFVTVQFDISWRIFLPILFTIGALYILCREWIESYQESEEEREEDKLHELEERRKKK